MDYLKYFLIFLWLYSLNSVFFTVGSQFLWLKNRIFNWAN